MKYRHAKRIAKRCRNTSHTVSPYKDMQLFNAFSRLHRAWRKYRKVSTENGQTIHWVTSDYFRESWVSNYLTLHRFFRGGVYRANAPENKAIASWIRKTWKPPHS